MWFLYVDVISMEFKKLKFAFHRSCAGARFNRPEGTEGGNERRNGRNRPPLLQDFASWGDEGSVVSVFVLALSPMLSALRLCCFSSCRRYVGAMRTERAFPGRRTRVYLEQTFPVHRCASRRLYCFPDGIH